MSLNIGILLISTSKTITSLHFHSLEAKLSLFQSALKIGSQFDCPSTFSHHLEELLFELRKSCFALSLSLHWKYYTFPLEHLHCPRDLVDFTLNFALSHLHSA